MTSAVIEILLVSLSYAAMFFAGGLVGFYLADRKDDLKRIAYWKSIERKNNHGEKKLFAGSDESLAGSATQDANQNVGGFTPRDDQSYGVGNPVVVSENAKCKSAAGATQPKAGGASGRREDTSSSPASPRPKADAPLKERLAYWDGKI